MPIAVNQRLRAVTKPCHMGCGFSRWVRTVSGIAGRRFLREAAGSGQRGPRDHSRVVGGVTGSPRWYMGGGPQLAASGVVTHQSATVCSGLEALRFDKALLDAEPPTTR